MIRPILILAAAASAWPAAAQVGQGQATRERYIQIREGEQCPRSTDPDEVIVCGFERETERFRIPERFRGPLPEDATTNTQRVAEAEAAMDGGTGSCSAVGPGGFTGCSAQEYQAWAAQRRRQQAVRERSVDD